MDEVQKNFAIAVAAFVVLSCMVVTAILGIGYYLQPPATAGSGNLIPSAGNSNAMKGPNNSYTTNLLENISKNGGSNMTADEVVAAREKIKEENAIPLFMVKTKYGLNDDEVNAAIDAYITQGKDGAYDYILNLSDKHPEIAEAIKDYNESGGDLSVIFG